jgi:1-acyl-sn-glycerol-3-phosphate acyltransferase
MKKVIYILIYHYFLKNFLRFIIGVKFHESFFLKSEKQFIIVANHHSHLDTMSILASLPISIIHKVKPVAAKDYFGKNKWHRMFFCYFVNTLLIDRKHEEKSAHNPIFQMSQALKEGYSLLIFPEGTRGNTDVVQPLKPGVALLLMHNPTIKYIPAYLKGMEQAMPKGDNFLLPHTASLVYGKPTEVKEYKVESILTQIQDDFDTLKLI